MDDEAYAARLLAILTNPHPTGVDPADPYRQADDGIDRHNGFGRDVRVEWIEVADGPHGAELVVVFGLELPNTPELQGVPRSGTVRLPLDARWRELSGYADPAAYAPSVAHEVDMAAGKHVERHRPGLRRPLPPVSGRKELWQLLLDALSGHGDVREVAPGRVELQAPDGALITVVVSAEEWERVVVEHARDDVEMYVEELLGPRHGDQTFVVCYRGDLTMSTREELPPVRSREVERMQARLRAEHPGARFGWFAFRPERPESPGDAD